MYYNRKLSDSFSALIEPGGAMRWLFDFVKDSKDMDFQIGRNADQEWISVYRGTTRIVKIRSTNDPAKIAVDGDNTYQKMSSSLFGHKHTSANFQIDLEEVLQQVARDPKFDRYYNNKKEGYFQNELSRKYGIHGLPDDDFVIVDKEAVIGYADENEKSILMGPIRDKYKKLQKEISELDSVHFGQHLENRAIGNELDFLALDREGNILLIEYKHGTNTSGIYLSPMQIGMYYDLFASFPKNELEFAVNEMLIQKQKIGLINPGWVKPTAIREIIPVLIISNYNDKSSAREKFHEVMNIVRAKHGLGFLKNLKTFNYTSASGLVNW